MDVKTRSFALGLVSMGFGMSVPYLGLTRMRDGNSRHNTHGEAICLEAGYERASRSRTVDRTLSDQNTYVGYRSGQELWDELVRRAEDYKIDVTYKRKGKVCHAQRAGLKKNGVVGFAVIWKPPADVVRGWDRDTRERFFDDCYAVAEELEPDLFRSENLLMRSRHND